MYNLKQVEEVYSVVGKHPFYYNLFSKIFFRRLRKTAVESLGLKKGDNVLEIACGTGVNIPDLEKKVGKEGKIYAVDYVKEMAESAKKIIEKRNFQNVKVIQGDVSKIKLKEKFDAVLSIIGISAVPDHISALKNIKSMLKKKGVFVVLDGKNFDKQWRFLNFIIRIMRWSKSYDQKKEIIKDIKKIFKDTETKKYFLGSIFITKIKNN